MFRSAKSLGSWLRRRGKRWCRRHSLGEKGLGRRIQRLTRHPYGDRCYIGTFVFVFDGDICIWYLRITRAYGLGDVTIFLIAGSYSYSVFSGSPPNKSITQLQSKWRYLINVILFSFSTCLAIRLRKLAMIGIICGMKAINTSSYWPTRFIAGFVLVGSDAHRLRC